MTGPDKAFWYMHGRFEGTMTVFGPDGKQVITSHAFHTGNPADRTVRIERQHQILGTFSGYGRHTVRNRSGEVAAYLVLSALDAEDAKQLNQEDREIEADFVELHTVPERFTPNDGKRSWANPFARAGLACGYLAQQGVSWKTIGYASVTARCQRDGAVRVQRGKSTWPTPLDGEFAVYREQQRRLRDLAPKPDAAPVTYWALAAVDRRDLPNTMRARNGKYAVTTNGRWSAVSKSGSFTGYGKHTVTDEHGKPALILDVQPLSAAPGK